MKKKSPTPRKRLSAIIAVLQKNGPALAGIGRHGLPVVFFALFFIFILAFCNPKIIFTCNGFDLYPYIYYSYSDKKPSGATTDDHAYGFHQFILEITPAYVKSIVTVPGGLTKLLTTLVIYACHYPVVGALAITVVAWLLGFLFSLYVKQWGARLVLLYRYLPALFILTTCEWYELQYLSYLIPIIGTLLFSILYQRFSGQSRVSRILALGLMFWLAYYFFQWAALLFILFVFIHEIARRSNSLLTLCLPVAISIAAVYWIEHFRLPIEQAINWREFYLPIVPPIIIIAYFPLVAAALNPLTARVFVRQRPMHSAGLQSALVALFVTGFLLWSFNDPLNKCTRVMGRTIYHLQNRQWEPILKEKTSKLFKDYPIYNHPLRQLLIHAVDRALYHTGRLGDDLYSYPQAAYSPEPLLLVRNTLTYGFVKWVAALDLYMDLGFVNLSEKVVGELMENMGPYPSFLYRRALIQAAKGNYETASVYATRLRGMPFYRKEARQITALLNDPAALASDSRISRLRATMDTTAYYLYQISEEAMLAGLLIRNPNNRMAYEYLMAYYLQTGQLEKIVSIIWHAADFGYRYALPRLWEEALCIYDYDSPTRGSTTYGAAIQPQTMALLDRYIQAYSQYKNNPAPGIQAALKLKDEFGATYFYNYTFIVKNRTPR